MASMPLKMSENSAKNLPNNSDYSGDIDCDEGEELVLEGSDLHTYLKSCFDESIGVYKHENKTKEVCYPTHLLESKMASRENLKSVHIILNCNILMEEDASYLFNISSDFIPENKLSLYSKRIALIIFFLEAFFAVLYLHMGSMGEIFLPIITGLLVLFSSIILHFYNIIKNKKVLERLIHVLQETYLIVRKIMKNIAEDDSTITSKEILLKLRGDDHLGRHNLRKKIPEVIFLASHTIYSLKRLIILSQNLSLSLMKTQKPDTIKHEDYIAFCSDDQLGLNLVLSDSDNNYLAVLDTLKNVYLLMQSECLRVLGVCFLNTHSSNVSKLFETVSIYNKEASSILCILQKQFENYYFPASSFKGFNSFERTVSENNILIHNISKQCFGLLVDIRHLEEYIETNDISSGKNLNYASLCLVDIEKELNNILELVKSSKSHFLKFKPQAQVSNGNTRETTLEDSIPKVHLVNVGFSDFSISGVDEVFLSCSNNDNNFQTENNVCTQEEEFKPPASLINELKSALIKKREEFELRELNALKTPEEIEAYKFCSDSNLILVSGEDGKDNQSILHKRSFNSHESTICSNITQNTLIECPSSLGTMQKDIALAASNLSAGWSFMKSVDYFEGDESE